MYTDLLLPVLCAPILVVDDDRTNLHLIEHALSSRGFTHIVTADSAEAALAELGTFQPELIILDVMMPGMNGFDCCEQIRRKPTYKDIPIIIQTSLDLPEERFKAFRKGATDFIGKPIFADELSARVRVHLEKRLYLNQLQRYHNRMEAEMHHARLLQYSILPQERQLQHIRDRCGIDVAGYLKPSADIGGDFWGVGQLSASQTGLWNVDFSGHGVAATLNAFRLQAYIREHFELATHPGEYLSYLNACLLQVLMPGQFATMFYGIIDRQRHALHYATACTPHPILLRASSSKADLLDGSGYPLGVGIAPYLTQSIPLYENDIILLYSDGFTESPGFQHAHLSEERLGMLLVQHRHLSATGIKQEIIAFFEHYAGATVADDLTLVVCRMGTHPGMT